MITFTIDDTTIDLLYAEYTTWWHNDAESDKDPLMTRHEYERHHANDITSHWLYNNYIPTVTLNP